jgi:hypothetical protein
MQILDFDNQGSLLTAPETHLLEGVKGPCPDRFWSQRCQAFCPRLHPEQLEEIWRRVLGVHADFVQCKAYLLKDRVGALGLADTTVMAQHVDQGMVRNTATIRETAPFEICHTLVL